MYFCIYLFTHLFLLFSPIFSDKSGEDSGTDNDEGENEEAKQKKIPEWARGQLLKEALERVSDGWKMYF